MSQKAFLQEFDRAAITAFAPAGLADSGAVYTPRGGGHGVPCSVMVDRGIQAFGDDPMPVAVYEVVISLFRAEVVGERDAVVEVDGERYRLTDKLSDDGSRVRWAVARA
ncbi:head-tail joining protein [Stenotrophomonas maltophilia]|uniref:head-tail joining protein n=1 Tax=Stenotrophomonas maltophilia TaxID=40324 RepID=UPI00066D0870|nr:hypothetical protein [Stenotrophomonas maltophilia]